MKTHARSPINHQSLITIHQIARLLRAIFRVRSLTELVPAFLLHLDMKLRRCFFDVGESAVALLIGNAFDLVETRQRVLHMRGIRQRFFAFVRERVGAFRQFFAFLGAEFAVFRVWRFPSRFCAHANSSLTQTSADASMNTE